MPGNPQENGISDVALWLIYLSGLILMPLGIWKLMDIDIWAFRQVGTG